MKLLGSFRKPEPVRLGSLLILYALIAVFLAGCAMLVAAALGAQDRSPSLASLRVTGMSIVPLREMGGAFTQFEIIAVVQSVEHMPSGEVVVKESRIVKFDLVRGAPESVTVNGAHRRYHDIAASLYAAALQEYEQAQEKPSSPPPLPGVEVERKLLRNQPRVP